MPGRSMMSAVASLGAVVVALALATGAAGAKKATIGSDLKGEASPFEGYSCGTEPGTPPCAVQQLSIPDNRFTTKAPFRGTIRKWRFKTIVDPAAPYELRLRVVRKTGPGEFEFVRRSAPGLVDEAGRSVFRSHLRIREGDFIALELPGNATDVMRGFSSDRPGARNANWIPVPANGAGGEPTFRSSDTEYFYNARIKQKRRR